MIEKSSVRQRILRLALPAMGERLLTMTVGIVDTILNLLNIMVAWAAINGRFGLPKMGVAGSALGALVGQAGGGQWKLVEV